MKEGFCVVVIRMVSWDFDGQTFILVAYVLRFQGTAVIFEMTEDKENGGSLAYR